MQPSEAFLTRILLAKGLSDEQLENEVWAADAYAALILMLVVTAASDWLGQRAIVALGLVAWQVVCALLVMSDSVEAQIAMQVAYAFTTSARVVYFAYLFSVFGTRDLELATACAIAAHHLGSVIGSGLSQILVQFVPLFTNNVANLVFVSWGSVTLALIVFAVAMPGPVRAPQQSFTRLIWVNGWRRSFADMRATLSSVGWQWLAWWSFAVAGNEIFGNYFQMIVARLGKGSFGYGTMAVLIEIGAIIGAVGPIVVAKLKVSDSLPVHATIVSMTSIGMGLLLVFTGLSESAWAASGAIVAIHFVFSAQEGTANVAIAGLHQDSRPSLVFGVSTFLALSLASVAQAVASSLKLKSPQYMFVCAALYIGIPLMQALAALVHRLWRAKQKADHREPLIDSLAIEL